MSAIRWFDALAALLIVASLFLPVAVLPADAPPLFWIDRIDCTVGVAVALLAALLRGWSGRFGIAGALAALLALLVAGLPPLAVLAMAGTGGARLGLWLYAAGVTLLAWGTLARMCAPGNPAWLARWLVAATFGIALLWYWEVVVIGFAVPVALLPPPSAVWTRLVADTAVLWTDFRVTFFGAVLTGFAIGSIGGFAFAIAADRSPRLAAGLLPLGSAFSAIPIVAVAPIMIMWFGFGSASKAAVIALMTFFPMLVGTLAGLRSVDRLELDLLQSYAAGYWTTLWKLRLPAALPFIFTALKVNSSLAMIGAIVAEFFGTPLNGMGFRISASIGRLELDMVWATIAVAAVAGSAFYGLLALLERRLTFWHPSFRGARHENRLT